MIDLRTATTRQLETLPGIGPVLAYRIIRYRETADQFTREDDLLLIRGIGEKLLARLRPLVTVRGPKHRAEVAELLEEVSGEHG